MTTPNKVLAIAKKEVDGNYKEGNNNDTKYGKWYGINNQPWCAIFVSYCFRDSHLLDSIQTKHGFHNCTAGLDHFRKLGQLVEPKDAQPGDIVFFNFDGNPATAEHVGIVYVNQIDKQNLVTFEGNTSNTSGSANGDGCYKMNRAYGSKIAGIARPQWSNS
ncbi:TIGR02594, TIGR02594 family protein [uncultured Caudovirales phage]|uniref:TIGR02594, TIGR02594 family protein n=1 Tax=uncultured Caudovirales phage TaxID=2100421 RepID=A0A6J5RIY6_9CAUD|nr:TIGR02594, TIGR02594 family protein [uncultured Caudovirales phage]